MNRHPTPGQILAGNYAKDRVSVHGLRVSIENPAGSKRSGTDKDGKAWSQTMAHDYGYIRGTTGRDKDHIDVFLGADHANPDHPVHVVDQSNSEGNFDEHKVMLGFKDADEAIDAYHANYPKGWDGMKAVTPMHMDDFKQWAFKDGARTKPVSELGVQAFKRGGHVQHTGVRRFEDGGAAFGIYPGAGRRSPGNSDPEAAKEMPLQALRGWAAGTAGLPGDMEGLARHLIPGVSNDPALPTSDFYKEWLPGGDDRPGANAAGALGSLFGGVGVGSLVKGAVKSGKVLGKEALRAIDNAMMSGEGALGRLTAPAQPMYAVKPKGGNWLEGSHYGGQPPSDFAMDVFGRPGWASATGHEDIANWGQNQFTKYMKNQFGTADDPLLKLEAEGRLHYDPNAEAGWIPEGAVNPRKMRIHKELTGRTEMTPHEQVSAGMINDYNPEDLMSTTRGFQSPPMRDNPWLAKLVDSDQRVYNMGSEDPMQWGHVADYLKTARRAHDWRTSPTYEREMGPAGLQDLIDRGLHLSPEQLARTSVADASAKTKQWDDLLNKQKQLTDLNKGVKQVHKTYDTGHQWVELSPEGLAGEGEAMRHCVGGYCSQVEDGKTRILSLRDPKGKPAVTVEVDPGKSRVSNPDQYKTLDQLSQHERQNFSDYTSDGSALEDYAHNHLFNPSTGTIEQKIRVHPQPEIRQIKGPANRAPSKEVLGHVQDLVKNGLGDGLQNWGDVRDLRNAGLTPIGGRHFTEQELRAAHATSGHKLPFEGLGMDYFDMLAKNKSRGDDADMKFLNTLGFKEGGQVRRFMEGGGGDGPDGNDAGGPGPGGDSQAGGNGAQNGPAGETTGGVGDYGGAGGFGGEDAKSNTGQMMSDMEMAGIMEGLRGEDSTNSLGLGSSSKSNPSPAPASTPSIGSMIGSFAANTALNALTGGAYGLANTGVGLATGQTITDRLGDLISGNFSMPDFQGNPQAPNVSMADHETQPMGGGALGATFDGAQASPGNTAAAAQPAWADPLALGHHQLRVYDPIFAPGTTRPGGY